MRALLCVLLFCSTALSQEWRQLFNGKNLDGWIPKIAGSETGENFANTFRVENGVLKVSYDGYDTFRDRFGHLFYKEPFSKYVLAIEYRFTGEQAKGGPDWAYRNSGVMLHCQSPDSMRKDQDFPISIEAQFLGGRGTGERPTANVCTPGTHIVMNGKLEKTHCINSTSKTYHGDQWVRVEIEVNGSGVVRHKIDGVTVLEYEQPQYGGEVVHGYDPAVKRDGKLIERGWIALQAESHPIEFRKVEIRELK